MKIYCQDKQSNVLRSEEGEYVEFEAATGLQRYLIREDAEKVERLPNNRTDATIGRGRWTLAPQFS